MMSEATKNGKTLVLDGSEGQVTFELGDELHIEVFEQDLLTEIVSIVEARKLAAWLVANLLLPNDESSEGGRRMSEQKGGRNEWVEQVKTVRNFPGHVGGYDAELPYRKCGDEDYHGVSCFRDGWACAVDAINKQLTKIQKTQNNKHERAE
jgi:hypothetical protein